ncbi:MAG TPA: hypothetical protein VJ204_01530 [Solirubrobacterales bacterium]|nr:hypothetical protein [Solirubrobacterales bacterium]
MLTILLSVASVLCRFDRSLDRHLATVHLRMASSDVSHRSFRQIDDSTAPVHHLLDYAGWELAPDDHTGRDPKQARLISQGKSGMGRPKKVPIH